MRADLVFENGGLPRAELGVHLVDADRRNSPMERLPEEPPGRHRALDHVEHRHD